MITIEDVRAVGEPRRSYNWEVDFFDDTLLILAQDCNFPVDNLLPREVSQGNLQFSVYADRQLGLLTVSFVELDSGYITSWYTDWFSQCIYDDGIVNPVGRTARECTVRDKTLDKSANVSYDMLVVPLQEAQYQRNYTESGPVVIQLTFQILEITVSVPSSNALGELTETISKMTQAYQSMSSGGVSLSPIGADGSGGFLSPDNSPISPSSWSELDSENLAMPDGTLAPIVTASSVSGTAFPDVTDIVPDMDFSSYTIPPATIDQLKDQSKWSYWPGLGSSPGMNIPLPTGVELSMNGINVSLGPARYRTSYPKITTSGGPINSAGGVVNGSTFYSTDSKSPDIGTKFIGDMGSLTSFLGQVDVTMSNSAVSLDVGAYMDLGPLGNVFPNPNKPGVGLNSYAVSPIRSKASLNLKAMLKTNNIRLPLQVSFR